MAKFDDKLAGLLTKCRIITKAQRDEALWESERTNSSLTKTLIDKKFCDEGTLVSAVAKALNYYPINLSSIEVSPEALAVLTEEQTSHYQALPIAKMEKIITLAIANPFDVLVLDDVKIITGYDVIPILTTEVSVNRAIERARWRTSERKGKSAIQYADDQVCPKFEEENQYNIHMRSILTKMGYVPGQVSEKIIANRIVHDFSLPFVSALQFNISPEVLSLFPMSKYYEFQFIAVDKIANVILTVGAGLMSFEFLDELEKLSGCQVCQYISTWSDIRSALGGMWEGT